MMRVATQTSVIEQAPCPQKAPATPNPKATTNSNPTMAESMRISIYDKMLPKNEAQFMSFVRNWEKSVGFLTPVKWMDAALITLFHVLPLTWFAYTVCFCYTPKWQTLLFGFVVGLTAGFGVTAGAHRYWSHRSFRARRPLQLLLLLCYSVAGQNTIYNWVRDHRVHHKYSETSADPHDARRGFFFSHVGWLMMKKHPAVLEAGATIDMSDIDNDPLVQFHTKYFKAFKLACCFVLPMLVPALWAERWELALQTQTVRYLCSLHFTWAVNSFAHLWGNKPFDRHIMPVENWGVSVVAMGEGWHNYHHTFPWDYKAAELGASLNLTTRILDLFARLGWAYDLKTASPALVDAVAKNRGDGTKVFRY